MIVRTVRAGLWVSGFSASGFGDCSPSCDAPKRDAMAFLLKFAYCVSFSAKSWAADRAAAQVATVPSAF